MGLKAGETMYCSSCGFESTAGPNYCNRCGANLGGVGEENLRRGLPPWLLGVFVITLGFVGLVGPMAVIEGGRDLVRSGAGLELVVPLLVCGSGLVLGMSGLLVWLLMKLLKVYGVVRPAPKPRKQLTPAAPAQFAPPPRGVASVTEHTTRHFEAAAGAAINTADMN